MAEAEKIIGIDLGTTYSAGGRNGGGGGQGHPQSRGKPADAQRRSLHREGRNARGRIGETALSLGIETLGGIMTRLVERNATIPTAQKQVFSTAEADQTAVTVKVYQGERQMATDNRLLRQFNLDGLPPAARHAADRSRFRHRRQRNSPGLGQGPGHGQGTESAHRADAGLSKEEIERRRRDADLHAEEDKQKRQPAELRNQADTMTWQLERLLQEHEAKLRAPDKQSVTTAIEKTRSAAKGDNVETLKAAIQQLEQVSHALSRSLYATANAETGAASTAPETALHINPAASPATRPLMAPKRMRSMPSSWSNESETAACHSQ